MQFVLDSVIISIWDSISFLLIFVKYFNLEQETFGFDVVSIQVLEFVFVILCNLFVHHLSINSYFVFLFVIKFSSQFHSILSQILGFVIQNSIVFQFLKPLHLAVLFRKFVCDSASICFLHVILLVRSTFQFAISSGILWWTLYTCPNSCWWHYFCPINKSMFTILQS